MDSSALNFLTHSTNRKVRKLLGRVYLREYRVEEALRVFSDMIRDYPDDPDGLIVLGNLYRLGGSPSAALELLRQALKVAPGSLLVEAQINQARADARNWEETAPLSPDGLNRLALRLHSETGAQHRQAIREAADVLDENFPAEDLLEKDTQRVGDLQQLMPALIELNIRQARASGNPEEAEVLQSLQFNLIHQMDEQWRKEAGGKRIPPRAEPGK